MPIIGHSDEDLRKREEALQSATTELEKQKSDLDAERQLLEHERQVFESRKDVAEKERTRLEKDLAELETRRQEVLRQEAAAKARFAESQRQVFGEVIQARLDACGQREKELVEFQDRLAAREEAVSKREGEVARRELDVTGREQQVDAGLPAKVRVLAEETRRKELALAEEAGRLEKWAGDLAQKARDLESAKSELATREAQVKDDEARRDADFSEQRASLAQDLSAAKEDATLALAKLRGDALAKQESDIAEIRVQRFLELENALEKERNERLAKLEEELAFRLAAADRRDADLDARDAGLQEALAKAGEDRRALDEEKASLERDRVALARDGERRRRKEEERESALDEEVEERVAVQCAAERAELAALRQSVGQLKDELEKKGLLFEQFDAFKRQFGERDPSEVLRVLDQTSANLRDAKDALAARPTQQQVDKLTEEVDALKREREEFRWEDREEQLRKISRLEAEKQDAEADRDRMKRHAELSEMVAERFRQEYDRLCSAYAKPADREERINAIRSPVANVYAVQGGDTLDRIAKDHGIQASDIVALNGLPDPKCIAVGQKLLLPASESLAEDPGEIAWLDGVGKACDDYGIHFPKRILYAFHTALKTFEMSPLTVLAGVSGTGKSELPRLYSHFGGLYFEPVSVQPNWDSQEAMLGFFNSIDNAFEAQRLLRFLAQSQEAPSKERPAGLKDAMCMVLLDEMNLAHPELYFAEFLSKFETRRGITENDKIPCIDIKIGSKMDPYQLPLGRNVLWTGTMNQDETTKSLSDKVLDRAIVIHFPRPRHLARRTVLKKLDAKNRGRLMPWAIWMKWLKGKSAFDGRDDLIGPYLAFLEEINAHLGKVGRAIGHRVWQSVEAYMSAYPGMDKAIEGDEKDKIAELMHVAFEDQLVQKVMPKLRGIDTRGDSLKDCLAPIRAALQEGVGGKGFQLDTDFELACKLGYGQFIWQSANYIEDDDARDGAISESPESRD